MNRGRTRYRLIRQCLVTAFACFLSAGPGTLLLFPLDAGTAWALERGGGRPAKAAGSARAQKAPSKVDRKPRAASAEQGSMRRAASAPARAAAPARTQRPVAADRSAAVKKPAARPQPAATSDTRERLASREQSRAQRDGAERAALAERQAKERDASKRARTSEEAGAKRQDLRDRKDAERREDRRDELADKRDDRKDDISERREQRAEEVADRRKEYQDNREDIREDRLDALEELQGNRLDYLEEAREDRHDLIRDLQDERMDLWEDVYDDRRYWGDWDDDDDDNEWLWGIVGGVVGYAIGAAVNSPPEGTVPVVVPGSSTQYQYYGGAFYQPAPTGSGYVTTPAPVGAQVEAPPIDCTIVFAPDDQGYCFFQGAFFLYDEKHDQYVVAEPPTGTSVPYLPDGYEEETIDGAMYMKLGPTYYRPYYEGDEVVYVVTKV
jgi:hypothetical protein